MDKAVQTGFRYEWIPDYVIPVLDRELGCDNQSLLAIAVVDKLLEVVLLLSLKFFHSEVIKDQQIRFCQSVEEGYGVSLQTLQIKSFKQPLHVEVPTHRRSFDRFNPYVTDESHLASNSAWIRNQNIDAYRRRASAISPELEKYVSAVFEDGISRGFAVECRYNTCNGILANARRYPPHIIAQACLAAAQRQVFSSKAFSLILLRFP